MDRPRRFGTFSIVAHDPERKEWGVAVQSRFIAVGSVVPWAEARAGAIATQAQANAAYGPEGLRMLRAGKSAAEVGKALVRADSERDHRQLGIVDARGGAWAHTGSKCLEWAGHETGDGFACQGNILFSAAVVRGMARTFEATPGDLPDRLLAALAAGQREGGDRRGMQSAALLVVKEKSGYGGSLDRWIDLRVDDHASPIEELRRVFRIYDMTLLEREDPKTLLPRSPEVLQRLQEYLSVLGYLQGRRSGAWDLPTETAYTRFVNEHNFENKTRKDGRIWPSILEYLRQKAEEEIVRRRKSAPIVPGALDRGPGADPGADVSKIRKGSHG
jgi:uncharacterized Ntn-hydrolase superfamily protein